ncbi:MAG: MG2 domain-containing protein, partial [Bacteroidales bacterium]
ALALVLFLISSSEVSTLQELLSRYRVNSPSERLYLQIDRELYQPGDTLWFSAYNRNFRKQSLSLASSFLHLSLLNPEGKEIIHENFYLSKARGKGDILLPAELEEGDYNLIAFTSWMKKGSPENVFNKKISVRKVIPSPFTFRSILNDSLYNNGDKVAIDIVVETPGNKILNNLKISWSLYSDGKRIKKGVIKSDEEGIAKLEFNIPELLNPSSLLVKLESEFLEVRRQALILIPTPSTAIDLQFLPEGGSFVSGLKNKIAFKALNILGEPVDLSGYLEDEKGKRVVDSISSTFEGMGQFSFTPDFSGSYYFIVSKSDIYAGKYPLPDPDSAGLVMNVEKKEKLLKFSVTRAEGNVAYNDLLICGVMNDNLVFKEEIPNHQRLYTSSLETAGFPAGI